MANWNGKAGKGAMRTLRESKRAEAVARQASFRKDLETIVQDHPTLTAEEAHEVTATMRRDKREQ